MSDAPYQHKEHILNFHVSPIGGSTLRLTATEKRKLVDAASLLESIGRIKGYESCEKCADQVASIVASLAYPVAKQLSLPVDDSATPPE